VEHRFCQRLLHLRVLVLKRPKPLSVRHLHSPLLRLPFVKRGIADAVFAADISRLRTSFLLPQNANNLLFREPIALHVHPRPGYGLYQLLEDIEGLTSRAASSGTTVWRSSDVLACPSKLSSFPSLVVLPSSRSNRAARCRWSVTA